MDEDKDYGFEVVATHSHYCHEYTCRTTNGGDPHDELWDWIESDRIDLCREIYRQVQEQYDYEMSDEFIVDTVIANEYLFTKDGSIVPQSYLVGKEVV